MPKNKTKKNWIERIFVGFIYALPVALIFSYYPIISFGGDETMNFELSLPLIWLVLFDALVVILFFKRRLWKNIAKKWVFILFPIFASLSIIWSLNLVRGVLTVGILWLIYLAVFGFFELCDVFLCDGFWWKWRKVFYGAGLFACGFCLLQCVLDLAGCGQEVSLLCDGCTYKMFGFPHPNGFAVEPQFMGNLLLAPAILAGIELYYSLSDDGICASPKHGNNNTIRRWGSSRPSLHWKTRLPRSGYRACSISPRFVVRSLRGSNPSFLGRNLRKPRTVLLFAVFAAALFLTFSRGAIYAFILAMLIFTVWEILRFRKWRVLILWPVIIFSFVFTLNLQGIFAQVSKTDDTYLTGVAKVINQLSLGVIEIPIQDEEVVETSEATGAGEENLAEDEAVFDGYVAESTDTRVRLSDVALKAWSKDFKTIMLGVGIGGAGQALYQNGFSAGPKEIVQNEYVSLLLETGIVGVALVILTVVLSILALKKTGNMMVVLVLAVAYGTTLLFFSGLPNALHIYLLVSLLLAVLPKQYYNL